MSCVAQFSNTFMSHQNEIKNLCNSSPITKTQWEVVVRRYFPVVAEPILHHFLFFTMVNSQLVECPWQPDFWKHTKLKLRTSISIPRSVVKIHLEVAVWCHFSVVSRPVRHPLFYSGQFSITSVPLADKDTKLKVKTSVYILTPTSKV